MKTTGFGNKVFDTVNFTLVLLLCLMIVLPFWYMFVLSVSDPFKVGMKEVALIPQGVNFKSYMAVLQENQIVNAYWNSIRYTVVGTFMVIVVACLTAYPLALQRFGSRKAITILFTITMFFSGGMIPTFMLIRGLGMLDTIWAVTLPAVFGFWNIIILRTNFQSLPRELFESAYMDGANDWRILFQIVIPLSGPILATLTLFASVGFWNAFFAPLLYLTSPEMHPLTIILRRVLVANEVLSSEAINSANSLVMDPIADAGRTTSIRMATVFVTIGPIVLIYPFVQRYFVKGILVGSVKG
ncbi:carbohydrate ABC transporter permease [Paenibacillus sp. IB182496]|uniref:Carbohydrate ABC transporter permease n=1 Tax=Paenibacillus sabuli TaxID=2772509 RepID=A0A927GTX0_9BACL|nr:carbohydrate ABC transporter permease [Paenibacillus sabuli]MBD2847530.1 carbohydrate ABC transporter permease [Paenibacillus sabuli]